MGVALAILAALAAAVCYGVASVLQSISTRRSEVRTGLDPRLVVRLLRDLPYLAGLALDLLGFFASVVALHRLPLFFVQAVITSSVGVTMLLAVLLLDARMERAEVVSLAVMGVGLLLLAVAARPETAHPLARPAQWVMLGGVAVVAMLGVGLSRRVGAAGAVGVAVVAGLGFSGVGVSARGVVLPHRLLQLVTEPLAWAVVGYGLLATLLFARALQKGSLTTTVAITFVVDTVVPAAFGLSLLGDRARPGLSVAAATGFILSVTGAIALARYAALPVPAEATRPR